MKLTPRQEVRELQRPEVSPLVGTTDRMVVPEELPGRAVELSVVIVPRAQDEHVHLTANAIELVVSDPIGLDDPAELDEEFARERLLAAEVFGLGDETEQPLHIPTGDGRHG